jgi:aryl-alcohol dehydrogenase
MNTITAAIAFAPGQDFSLEQVELDDPRDDEVLVKIAGVGICHSDIAAREQHLPVTLPAVLGHEGAGIVEKVGSSVRHLVPGDHVVLSFLSCGGCSSCNTGQPSYCLQGFLPQNFACMRADGSKTIQRDGQGISSNFFGQSSFGTYALAHATNAIKVRADAPIELLGPLGCGIQTGAGSVMKALACEGGSSLLITGGGAVGLAAVMGAVVQQCKTIIVVEPHAARRELALSLGATHVIDPTDTIPVHEAVRALVPQGMDYGFDTSARQNVIEEIVKSLRPAATLGLVGIPADEPRVSFDVITLLALGLKVIGITEGNADPATFIPEMVDLYMEGRFPFDRLCKTYSLDQINKAVTEHGAGNCVKPVLIP